MLLVNDHYLKAHHPGRLTGKLSDFAGLIFFPLLLGWVIAVITRHRHSFSIALLATGAWFTAVKILPAAARASEAVLGRLFPITPQIVTDSSDLIALASLLISWLIHHGARDAGEAPGWVNPRVIVAVAALATIATSDFEPPQTDLLIESGGTLYAVVEEDDSDRVLTYTTADGGLTWVESEPPPDRALHRRDIDQQDVRCDQSEPNQCASQISTWAFATSDDGGLSWTDSPGLALPSVYTGSAHTEIWRAGCAASACYRTGLFSGSVFVSLDGGSTWSETADAVPTEVLQDVPERYRCEIDPPSRCYRREVAGLAYLVSSDGGLSWVPLSDDSDPRRALWSSYSSGDIRQVVDPVCSNARGECFRIYRPEGAQRAHLERSTDGGLTWHDSWAASPRFPAGMGPSPRGLAFDRESGNLVVSLGYAGVVVGESDGGWVQSSVGGANETEIPGPFQPVGPVPIAAWVGTIFVLMLNIRLWVASAVKSAARPDFAAPMAAGAAALAAICLAGVIMLTRDYPYGLNFGPGWLRALAAPAAVGLGFLSALGLSLRWGTRTLGGGVVSKYAVSSFVLVALAGVVAGLIGAILGGYQ